MAPNQTLADASQKSSVALFQDSTAASPFPWRSRFFSVMRLPPSGFSFARPAGFSFRGRPASKPEAQDCFSTWNCSAWRVISSRMPLKIWSWAAFSHPAALRRRRMVSSCSATFSFSRSY
jgi:hypothetical protein